MSISVVFLPFIKFAISTLNFEKSFKVNVLAPSFMEGRVNTELDKMCLLAMRKQSAFKKVHIIWLIAKKASPAPTTSPTGGE